MHKIIAMTDGISHFHIFWIRQLESNFMGDRENWRRFITTMRSFIFFFTRLTRRIRASLDTSGNLSKKVPNYPILLNNHKLDSIEVNSQRIMVFLRCSSKFDQIGQ